MRTTGRPRAEAHLEIGVETKRDLFGRVRGRCGGCGTCAGYVKDTRAYEMRVEDAANGRAHPHCDLTLTNCSRCGCASTEHEVDECADWRERGNDAYEREAYEEAVCHYSRAIAALPGDVKSFSNRSACFLKMAKYSQALSDAERAVTLDGNFAKARTRVGAAAAALGRHDLAKRSFELALKLDPNSQAARDGLVRLERDVSRPQKRKTTRSPSNVGRGTDTSSTVTPAVEPARVPHDVTSRVETVARHTHAHDLIGEAKSLLSRLERVLNAMRIEVDAFEKHCAMKEAAERIDVSAQTEEESVHGETLEREIFDVEPQSPANKTFAVSPRSDGIESEHDMDDVSTQMARLLRAASVEDDEGEDEAQVADVLKFFEEFERFASGETEKEDVDLWAERWEEEQFQRRSIEKIVLETAQKRQSSEPKVSRPPGLKLDSLTHLFTVEEIRGKMGDIDDSGTARGPCKSCDKSCSAFVKLSSWKRSPLPNHDANDEGYANVYHSLVLGVDGARCARCGCEASMHCTEKEFRKRERVDRMDQHRKQSHESDRKRRVMLAAEIVQRALDQDETICETTNDAVLGAERLGCKSCQECPGFKLIFPESKANDPETMCYCSMCGCSAADHQVCERWTQEQQESRNRFERRAQADQARRAAAAEAYSRSNRSRNEHRTTLGVSPNASMSELAKSYRKAALRWHPDKHAHKSESERRAATKMFIRVAEAFKCLRDEDS